MQSIFLTRWICVLETKPDFRKLRLRFVVFFVRMWLALALSRFICLLAVTENRFLAELLVRILGMFNNSLTAIFLPKS